MLDALVGSTAAGRFVAAYWEQRPLRVRASRARDGLRRLLSTRDVSRLLLRGGLRYPQVRVVREGLELPWPIFSHAITIGSHVIDDAVEGRRVIELHRAGATIVMQALQWYWPPLTAFCGALGHRLGHGVRANAYMTPASSRGFDAHWDTHDVFVVQLEGSKHWRVYDSPLRLPGPSQPFDPARWTRRVTPQSMTLRAGDVLYLPRGFIHDATAGVEPSLHVSLGIHAPPDADLPSPADGTRAAPPARRPRKGQPR